MMYEGWQVRRQYEHEHTRYIGAMLVNTSFNAPKKAISPRNLYDLSEIDGPVVKTSEEEIELFRQRMAGKLGKEIHFVKTAQA
jgi:hypothetical protein